MPKTDHRVTLTPTKISGLKPAKQGQRYQVMDALVPGFGVRVTDSGHCTFILRTRYPGSENPSRREIGACGEMALTEAREKARKWRLLVGQGMMVWTAPYGISCARMRLLQISDKGAVREPDYPHWNGYVEEFFSAAWG